MKTVYVVVGADISVTESTMRQLKAAAHGMILGNPEDMLVWRCDSIGEMAFYMTTSRDEAERYIAREADWRASLDNGSGLP